MEEISIRPATWEDATGIRDLHHRTIRELCADHYTAEPISVWTDHLVPEKYDSIVADQMYVAEVGGKMVGFGHAQQAKIQAIFVDPQAVRMGVGRRLVEEGIRRCGGNEVNLESTLNAVPFYQRCGFHLVGHDVIVRRGVEIVIARLAYLPREA